MPPLSGVDEPLLAIYESQLEAAASSTSWPALVAADIEQVIQADTRCCFALLPALCHHLPSLTTSNVDLIYHLVAMGEPAQLYGLVSQLVCGDLLLFGDRALEAVRASSAWEVYEQQSMWRLLQAEAQCNSASLESLVVTTLADVDASGREDDMETFSGIMMLLRGRVPTASLGYAVLSVNPSKNSTFAPCIMSQWLVRDAKLIGEVIAETYQRARDDEAAAGHILRNLTAWLRKPVCQSAPIAEMLRSWCAGVHLVALSEAHQGGGFREALQQLHTELAPESAATHE